MTSQTLILSGELTALMTTKQRVTFKVEKDGQSKHYF